MIVLGIDPGLERVGYALVRKTGSKVEPLDYGLIQTKPMDLPLRLRSIEEQFLEILSRQRPDAIATERLLFTVNKTTAMDVAKALGVILLVAGREQIPWCEYSPPEIKQTVVGNGNADKKQVQFMVTKLLGLRETPKPDDVADALAIAITHCFKARVAL